MNKNYNMNENEDWDFEDWSDQVLQEQCRKISSRCRRLSLEDNYKTLRADLEKRVRLIKAEQERRRSQCQS